MRIPCLLASLFLLVGCPGDGSKDSVAPYVDEDGDGFSLEDGDCDDSDSETSPVAEEVCDGVDNDCDGEIDEDDASDAATWQLDADGDGYGDPDSVATACQQPSGYVDDASDCDDAEEEIHPGASESCNGRDDDCDGETDEDMMETWYADGDGDGFGDAGLSYVSCDAPKGYVAAKRADCDDGDAAVNPDAEELCDGIDNDCDGETDEDDAVDATASYADGDGDGYGDADLSYASCDAPKGYVADDQDCDDGDPAINPEADERCDGADTDCDGAVDENDAIDALTSYADADGDGFGDAAYALTACHVPSGYVVGDDTDCDDADASVHPDATEDPCNDIDEDCDGTVDNSIAGVSTDYCADADGDTFGDATDCFSDWDLCGPFSGYTADDQDCDDGDAAVNPDAEELCDGIDNDCDGDTDEDEAIDASEWHPDLDGDGYGDAAQAVSACSAPSGHVADDTDCDDTDAAVNPGASEDECNDLDDDCDGDVDESAAGSPIELCVDGDGDGYGDADDCYHDWDLCAPASGYVADAGDCDDSDAAVNPAASEICDDGLDNDCDGMASGCAPVGGISLAEADAKIIGEDGYDYAGDELAFADVNGDGYDDLVVSAWMRDSGAGSGAAEVYLVLGPVSGDFDLSGAQASFQGVGMSDYAGRSVGNAGDLDGSGHEDIIIGAIYYQGSGNNQGAAYVVEGPVTGSMSLGSADFQFTGESSDDAAGYGTDGAGDVNGDGHPDLLIGAYGDDVGGSDAGAMYVVLGPVTASFVLSGAHAKLTGEAASDWVGVRVAGVGDVNGDGFDDVMTGARQNDAGGTDAGAAYLALGPLSGESSLSVADAKLIGEAAGDEAGSGVAAAGDVDADGYADLLVGSRYEDSGGSKAGAAYLLLGPVTGSLSLSAADAKLIGEADGDKAGEAVAGGGDLDVDGHDDLLVGAEWEDSAATAAGAAYLVYGSITGTLDLSAADAKLAGEAYLDSAGGSVCMGGDVNGDGADDLLVGALYESTGGGYAGAAYLVLGGGL